MKTLPCAVPRALLCLLHLLPVAGAALGQAPDEVLTKHARAWRDQAQVHLKLHTTFEIERSNKGLQGTRTVLKETLTLKSFAGLTDREEVYYSTFTPLKEINAWTLAPHGKRYVRRPVSRFTHKDVLDDQIFHDDSRSVQFMFPGIAPGAITHVDHVITYPDAHLFMGHFFASNAPVEESTLTVICDRSVDVEAVPFHALEEDIHYVRQEKRGRIVHQWTMRKVPPLKPEADAPSMLYHAPHVRLLIRNAGESAADDLDRFYAWNRQHVDHLLPDDHPQLVRTALEVTQGLATDEEKAAALFAWVQGRIKYIAVEDGLNGLVPAEAIDVHEARYGDCKGMANLLRALMSNAGLSAHLAWVGSRRIPYSYRELPTCVTDDHMVTAWRTGDSLLILDPTSSELPFGMPSAFIQGKETMVAKSPHTYRIMQVPAMPSHSSTITDSLAARLEGTDLTGSGSMHFTGYRRSEMATVLRRTDPARWKDIVRGMHMKGNDRFRIDSLWAEGLADRNQPLRINYRFTIPGFATRIGTELFIPAVLEKPFSDSYYRKERSLPVLMDFRWEHAEVLALELPPGIDAVLLPDPAAHEVDGSGYSFLQRVEQDDAGLSTLHLENRYRMNTLMLQPTQIGPWLGMLDQLERDMNRTLLAKPNNP